MERSVFLADEPLYVEVHCPDLCEGAIMVHHAVMVDGVAIVTLNRSHIEALAEWVVP